MAVDRDKYLKSKYGVDLLWFEERSKNGCEICGAVGKTRSLHVDHDHKTGYFKIIIEKVGPWASAKIAELRWACFSADKKRVREQAKKVLKTAAVRGTLCMQCNSGLKKFRDDPERLKNAAAYLERYQETINSSSWTQVYNRINYE